MILPPVFYPSLTMIVSAFASLILFLRIKKDHILISRVFFWNYASAFAILSLVNLPIFCINLGIKISYNFLLTLYTISFFAVLFAYLLFYRGTLALFIQEKFFTTIFPFTVFPAFAALTIFSLLVAKIETFVVYTVGVWGFLIPIDAFLATLCFYFFVRGVPVNGTKRRFSILLLSIGWFLFLILEIFLWYKVATSITTEFWILKIAYRQGWFLLRAIANLLLLVGALLYGRRLEHLEVVK